MINWIFKKGGRCAPRCAVLFALVCLAPPVSFESLAQSIVKRVGPDGKPYFTNLERSGPVPAAPAQEPDSGSRKEFTRLAAEAARTYGLPSKLVLAVMEVESDFDPNAVSSTGAMGLMQLMPETAEDLGVRNPYDPRENIFGGTRFLRFLLERFEGRTEHALAAYNAGATTVEKHNGIPPIDQTRRFVEKVMKLYGEGKGSRVSPIARSESFRVYVDANGIRFVTNVGPASSKQADAGFRIWTHD